MSRGRVLNMSDLTPNPRALDCLDAVADVVSVDADQTRLVEMIPDFDAYFASLHVRANADVLNAGQRLQVIATSSTGTDHIDVKLAEEKGIEVISIKHDYDLLDRFTATAELTFGLLFACVRKIPFAFDAAKQGNWARVLFRGHQVAHKTFGIIGYGRLGKMSAQYARAFRMRVIAHDPVPFECEGVERVDLHTLLGESDIIALHVHLTDETRGMISWDEFDRMKDGVILINTSRGGLIDEEAFLSALESGKVGAAGLDLIHGEWRKDLYNHPLIRYTRTHDNLVITPHVGGATFETESQAIEYTAKKLADYLRSLT